MENDNLSSLTREQLFQELRTALEGKYEEMDPERASQYASRSSAICKEITRRDMGVNVTIEIDKSVDKSIDLDTSGQSSRWDRFWLRYGDEIFKFCYILGVIAVIKYLVL